MYVQTGGQEAGDQPCGRRSEGLSWWQVEYEPTVCPGLKKGQTSPGVYPAQLVKGGDCPTISCTGVAPAQVLCAVLGILI